MPDEIDRYQAFNERCLEALIEQSRLRPTPTPSLQIKVKKINGLGYSRLDKAFAVE